MASKIKLVRTGALLGIAGLLFVVGCSSPTPGGNRIPTTPVMPNGGGGLISGNTAGLISNNAGSLTGVIKGPAAGLISNNSAGLISGNTAGLISGNTAGLISGNTAGYRILAASAPVANVTVAVYDERGEQVSEGTVVTDAQGRYKFERLKASSPLLFVQATYKQEGKDVTLFAAAPAPREPKVVDAPLTPGTTLVAKKAREMVSKGAVGQGAIKAETLGALATKVESVMSDKAVVAAAIFDAGPAAQTFDAMLKASPELRQAAAQIAQEANIATLVEETPAQAVSPSPSPTPSADNSSNAIQTVLAGSGTKGLADGAAADAQFNTPYGVAFDASGNLYVGDLGNNKVRKVAPDGTVSTMPGTFNNPRGVAVDAKGTVFVADTGGHRIRSISSGGQLSSVAGSDEAGFLSGPADAARFNGPRGVAVDAKGTIYVADTQNYCIRTIDTSGTVGTLAGDGTAGYADGTGSQARFQGPYGLAVDGQGNVIVADTYGHCLRKVTPDGTVSTLAGDGVEGDTDGSSARFRYPAAVAVDGKGNIYVADYGNNRIRKVTSDGKVSTVAGSTAGFADGANALFKGPYGVAVAPDGRIAVADTSNQRIRVLKP